MIPEISDDGPALDYACSAMECLEQTLSLVQAHFNLTRPDPSALDAFETMLAELEKAAEGLGQEPS